MNEKDLSERVKALHKAVQSSEPTQTIVAMIEGLRKEAAPTEGALRATKAGVVVGKLRSHANKEIAAAASTVVRKWKENVEASKAKKKASSSSPRNGTPSGASASPAPATVAPAPNSYSLPYTGDPQKRHFRVDNVDLNRTDNTIRNNCIGVMYNGLAYRSTAPIESVLAKATQVEHAAFVAYDGDNLQYRKKIRSLFQVLKNKTNRELGRRIMRGDISPSKFVKMTDNELKSDEQKQKDEALEKENMNKAQVAMPEKSVSDALTCGKCGKKSVSYTQAQTRSADEPMTTFCECLECGNRWKFS